MDKLKKLVPGATHGTTVTIMGFPFDTVKARMQTGLYTNSLSCIRSTWRLEGLTGFYRGCGVPLLSHMLKRPLQFPFFNHLINIFSDYPVTGPYMAGVVSAASTTLIGTPLQVIKIKQQTDSKMSTPQFIIHRYRQHGLPSFYKGFRITMMKDGGFGGCFLGTYYHLRARNGSDSISTNFFNGSVAHIATWALLFPIDLIKSTIQKSDEPIGIIQTIRRIYQEEGLRRFWRGLTPALIRSIPVSGFGMVAYELANDLIKDDPNEN